MESKDKGDTRSVAGLATLRQADFLSTLSGTSENSRIGTDVPNLSVNFKSPEIMQAFDHHYNHHRLYWGGCHFEPIHNNINTIDLDYKMQMQLLNHIHDWYLKKNI